MCKDPATKNNSTANNALGIHANIKNYHVVLNDRRYPDIDQNADFVNNKYEAMYRPYFEGCSKISGAVPIDANVYKNLYPIFLVDLTAQPPMLKGTGWNLALNIQRHSNTPNKVDVYILILENNHLETNYTERSIKDI